MLRGFGYWQIRLLRDCIYNKNSNNRKKKWNLEIFVTGGRGTVKKGNDELLWVRRLPLPSCPTPSPSSVHGAAATGLAHSDGYLGKHLLCQRFSLLFTPDTKTTCSGCSFPLEFMQVSPFLRPATVCGYLCSQNCT